MANCNDRVFASIDDIQKQGTLYTTKTHLHWRSLWPWHLARTLATMTRYLPWLLGHYDNQNRRPQLALPLSNHVCLKGHKNGYIYTSNFHIFIASYFLCTILALLVNLQLKLMRLCHPPDGSTSPKYKLLCFITTKKILQREERISF